MQTERWTYVNQASSGDPTPPPRLHRHGSSKATPAPLPAQRCPIRITAPGSSRGQRGVHHRTRPFCCTLPWRPEAPPSGDEATARNSTTQGDLRTDRCGLHPGLLEHLSWKPTTPTCFGCFSHCVWFCPFTQQYPDRLTGLQHDPQRPAWWLVQMFSETSHFPSRQRGTAKSKGHNPCQVAQGLPIGSTKHKRAMQARAST